MEPFALPPTSRQATLPVDAVRGFVFVSGRGYLRELGAFDRYLELLPRTHHTRFHEMTALEWVDLEEAMVGYRTCDALELTEEQQRTLGRVVSSANNGTVIETIARLAGGLGIAPWVPLQSMHKVWLRSNRGGAIAVYRTSDRAARIEVWQTPMARSSFFRVSMCGAVEHGLSLFRRAARVVEDESDPVPNGFALRATW